MLLHIALVKTLGIKKMAMKDSSFQNTHIATALAVSYVGENLYLLSWYKYL